LAATPTIENANSEIRPTSPSRATEGQNRPYERNLSYRNDNAAVKNAGSPISHRSIGSDLNNRPGKVVQILNGWKLKYSEVGVSVDNFIYRVEALTHQTLEGNFAILCRNASVLFEGKAYEFYWRYHKSVSRVQWDTLCFALRTQFREERDDVDVEELIRNRKQKTNESLDSFYDSVHAKRAFIFRRQCRAAVLSRFLYPARSHCRPLSLSISPLSLRSALERLS